MLVSLGSALVMLISVYGFPDLSGDNKAAVDVARIAAQVVSGVGFLGAGTIIRNGTSVKGLTTAASLWVSAAIGLACGSGFISAALFGCALSLVALWLLNKVDIKNRVAHRIHELEVVVEEREGWLSELTKVAEEQGLTVRSIRMRPERNVGKSWTKWLGAGQGSEQKDRSDHLSESDMEVGREGGHPEDMDDKERTLASARLLQIELKVLSEDVKSVAVCCEAILRLQGVSDVHMLS
ncbi:putative membrane protein [Paenibacillus sp. NAIST15-1]|nr:putative membrane protein [Paenibacillus sp. NAIST15-1]